jgi:type IV pilus assembly protein PilY1
MKTKKRLRFLLALPVALFFPNGAFSALLQVPVQVSAGAVPPNLMFTLDDSGSMAFECLPEDLCIGNAWVGTMPDMTPTWKNGVATPDSNSIFNRQMRSTSQNSLFYDPKLLYLPWKKKDGLRMPPSVPAAARQFPESGTDNSTTNLTIDLKFNLNWCTSTSSCNKSNETIYLAKYFDLTGTNVNSTGSYTEVKITSTGTYPRGTGDKASSRTDCVAARCTGAEELLNFANWYSYHRSRMRVAIAGTSEAFYSVPDTFRVGYGRINKGVSSVDGLSTATLEQGVRPFTLASGGSKSAFYDWLPQQEPTTGGTPLRRALADVGDYFSYTDSRGPWGESPGTTSATPAVACRRSFHILMTDGMWNSGGKADYGNADNTAGSSIAPPTGASYAYSPAAPYKDNSSNTLADVAMYYWKTDLYPALANALRPTSNDPAFWQHLVNYTIAFGVKGTLDPATDYPALVAGTKSWPTVTAAAEDETHIDDLWHAAVNSRGRYLSARNSTEYADALNRIIEEIVAINGSEAGVAVSAKAISTATAARKYEPTFASARWSGDVEAKKVTIDEADPTNGSRIWLASAQLPAASARNIFAFNVAAVSGTKAVAFNWASLTDPMKTKLYGATTGGDNLVSYLRGDRANESGGVFRLRTSALGDIVNSTPVLVKDQYDGQYDFLPAAASTGDTTKNAELLAAKGSYRRFLSAKKLRPGQLFVGANDGMLHAFNDTTGEESFAYVPGAVLGKMKNLSAIDYEHEYYVDGPTVEGDIYDAGASKWRNVVFGGTGAGAKSLFAINVPVVPWTSGAAPTAYSAAQSAPGAADVLWEISPATAGFTDMGNVFSAPEYGVMRDGTWVLIFGNGYESAGKKAQLFIVNALTGALIKAIDTQAGTLLSPNGLGGVRLVRDAQKMIVAAYAGDLKGNLWKFDLSSNAKGSWDVAFGGTVSVRNPLYTTPTAEPITAAPSYVVHPLGGVMVLFGSGKLFEVGDAADASARALYGVWDKVAIGATSTTASERVTTASTIVAQAFTTSALTGTTGGTFFGLTVVGVDYATKRGWRLPLTMATGQRLVDDPEILVGRVFMQTVSPATTVASCSASNLVRHGLVLDPFMSGVTAPTFDTNNDGLINVNDSATAVAVQLKTNGAVTAVRKAGTNKSRLLGAGLGGPGGGGTGGTGGGGTGDPVIKDPNNPDFQGGSNTSKRYWRQIVTQPVNLP